MEEKNKFVRVAAPNKATLAKLLAGAKGEGRTMKQFATECGTSQAAFSRIIHQSYKGPLSDEMIETIAEHADPESGVSLDSLMGANGMARVLDSHTVFRDSGIEVEKSFVNAVLLELERSDRLISYENDRSFQVGTTFKFRPDLLVRVKSEDKESYLWAFELIVPGIGLTGKQQEGNIGHHDKSIRVYGREFMEKMGRILPLFYNNEEPIEKFSLVIADRKIFDYFVSEYAENYQVPFEMSFILYNTEKEIMEKEVVLKKVE